MQDPNEEDSHSTVADGSDSGTQQSSLERTVSYASVTDNTWVIAIAAGIDNCSQPERAVEAAISAIPNQIFSKREMLSVLASVHDEIVALGPPWSLHDEPEMGDYSAVSLCIAAWSSLGGLIVGWAGDSVAFGIWMDEDQQMQTLRINDPHIQQGGVLTKVLGLHIPTRMLPEGVTSLAEVIADSEFDLPSDEFSVVLLSAGVWQSGMAVGPNSDQSQARQHLPDHLVGVGAGELADAQMLANSIRNSARQANSAETISMAVGRVTAEAQHQRRALYARSKYSEHDVFETPSPDTILWRYMDFPKFVSILERSALYFTRLDLMDDPFEGTRSRANSTGGCD